MDSFKQYITEREKDARMIAKAMKTQVIPAKGWRRFFKTGDKFQTFEEFMKLLERDFDVVRIGQGHFSSAYVARDGRTLPKEFVMKTSKPGRGPMDSYPKFAQLAKKKHSSNPFYPNVIGMMKLPRGKEDYDEYYEEETPADEDVWVVLLEYVYMHATSTEAYQALKTFAFALDEIADRGLYENQASLEEFWVSNVIAETKEAEENGQLDKKVATLIYNVDLKKLGQFMNETAALNARFDIHMGNVGISRDMKQFVIIDPVSFEE